jgi:hypothetical protein
MNKPEMRAGQGADPLAAAREVDRKSIPIDEMAISEAKARIEEFGRAIDDLYEKRQLMDEAIERMERTKRAEEARLDILTDTTSDPVVRGEA